MSIPPVSGLTAGQVAARRRTWFVKARRRCVAPFWSRLKRHQQAADRHRRGAEPEDVDSAHNNRSPEHLSVMVDGAGPPTIRHPVTET